MAELVDAPDLGSGTERCGGSIPSIRTIIKASQVTLERLFLCLYTAHSVTGDTTVAAGVGGTFDNAIRFEYQRASMPHGVTEGLAQLFHVVPG